MKKAQRKPLIGIITAQKGNGAIAGNSRLFKSLQQKLISSGGISFVFTVEGIHENEIDGFVFSVRKNSWMKSQFPFPDVVYNRIPDRTVEQSEAVQNFFSRLKEKGIPFFNPCFIDKYELYQCFQHDSIISKFLPKTSLIENKQNLLKLLETHSSIYLKPCNSSKGNGIYRLAQSPSLSLTGRKQQILYESYEQFWQEWGEKLLRKRYIAQEDIQSEQYNGKRFDFRILAHASGTHYVLTGIGIRQSQKQDITTHIPSGGRLVPYQLLQTASHDQFIQTIIPPIGKTLSERYGFFGEFSIDAAVSKTGQYYIYEVNSKPMSFDEPEIESAKIAQLCRLFCQLAKNDI